MPNEIDIINKFQEIANAPQQLSIFGNSSEHSQKVADHKNWLHSIRHEFPNPATSFKVGVYIRYFNQTRYEDYLAYHKKQFQDTINLCPNWTLVDFYIDEGATAPNMESAPEWSRLLNEAMEEDIFTLASYYQNDLKDTFFLPSPDWKILPEDTTPEFISDKGTPND